MNDYLCPITAPGACKGRRTLRILKWCKRAGDKVRRGEIALEIETDKAVAGIESPADGVIAGIHAKAGTIVPVRSVVGLIRTAGAS